MMQSRFAARVWLFVALAVHAGACTAPPQSLLCGGQRCADGETCRVLQTATSVQAMCVRDDGSDAGGERCGDNCPAAVCGDGVVSAGEICDDGNAVDLDGCKNDCTPGLRAYMKASNTDAGDAFGLSIALSADGSTLAVGARDESSAATGVDGDPADNSALYAGAVYVFMRSGARWTLQAYLKASNTNASDGFGASVALSADGSVLAVGAVNESSAAIGIGGDQADNSAIGAGAVYVFTRSGTRWSQQVYLKASNTERSDGFGTRLALSADGSTLAVSAINESSAATGVDGDQNDDSAWLAGAAYVFTRSGTTWIQQAYLKASNTDALDFFGSGLSLSADGSTLAVGAVRESSAATGIAGDQLDNSAELAGAVYVFRRSGATWTQEAYLKASNTDADDLFGCSVALSADGSALAVGACGEASAATGVGGDQADNTAPSAGAVYMFTLSDATWIQQAYLKASNTNALDGFGFSLALSSDGSILAVSAPGESSAATGVGGDQASNSAVAAGAAYVFTRTGTMWTQRAYLKASNTNAYDVFASSLALSADGSILAVGAPGESSAATGIDGYQADNSADRAGAAYVFY